MYGDNFSPVAETTGAAELRLTEWTSCGGCAAKWGAAPLSALVRQLADGSWHNPGDQAFGESDPSLATAFAVLTLSYCQSPRR